MTWRVEQDQWEDGPRIDSPESLARLRAVLDESPLIVEHRHYRAASAPSRLVFDDFEDLETYLRSHARLGDSFWCWRYDALCRDDNPVVCAKQPDVDGKVPRGGAY